jgi:hypothetical protein
MAIWRIPGEQPSPRFENELDQPLAASTCFSYRLAESRRPLALHCLPAAGGTTSS